MDTTAAKRCGVRAVRKPIIRLVLGALAAALLAAGFLSPALALAETTLTVVLKGVTPTDAETWLSMPMTGRFDVTVNGVAAGRVTANPSQAALAAGETDTLTIADASAAEAVLTPVAEDFADGFVCEGPIAVPIAQGEANRRTVLAYARRGLFRVLNAGPQGEALAGGEFAVLDASGGIVLSFTADGGGAYLATQALAEGEYRLVQMRAPQGSLLLAEPLPFTIQPYFGDAASIPTVAVVNQPAPLYNGKTGSPALASAGFALQGGRLCATLSVLGLCAGENDVPLSGYTLTLAAAATDVGALHFDSVTVARPDGLACTVQPLDQNGAPAGEAVTVTGSETVALNGAAGVSVLYLGEGGASTVPAGFTAGGMQVTLSYAAAVGEAAPAEVPVAASVAYTYQYPGADGVSNVTAPSDVAAATLSLPIPDGKATLAAAAEAVTTADGRQQIVLAQLAQSPAEQPLPVALQFPAGARVDAATLPSDLTLLRTADADTVVLDTARWAQSAVEIPMAAGVTDTLTLWVLDPHTLPATEADPEGALFRADGHAAQPLLDALAGITGGSYAQTAVSLTGTVALAQAEPLALLASGTLSQNGASPAERDAGLGALLRCAAPNTVYGTVTDATGSYAVYGDAGEMQGSLRVALPENAIAADGTAGFYQAAELSLPIQAHAVGYTLAGTLRGTLLTASGRPVSGAAVAALQNGVQIGAAQTDESGAFRFSLLPAGEYALLVTAPEGLALALTGPQGVTAAPEGGYTLAGLTLAEGETRDVALTAALLNAVRGAVTLGGEAAADLTVTLSDEAGRAAQLQTGADGAFAFTSLPDGTYTLSLALPANTLAAAGGPGTVADGAYAIACTLSGGETRTEAIALEAAAAITGSVTGLAAGQTVTAAAIGAQAAATANEGGSFLLTGLAAGNYTVYAPLPEGKTLAAGTPWRVSERGDMIWLTVSVAAGQTLALPQAAYAAATAVEGVAFLDADGDLRRGAQEQLMSGVAVALQRMENGAWADVADGKTDEYGHYSFQSLSEGEYRVLAQGAGGLGIAAVGGGGAAVGDPALGVLAGESLRLANGETVSGQSDIALSQPASLQVAAFFDSNENGLRGPYERSIKGVTVAAVPASAPEGDPVAQAVTDSNGLATLTGIPAGTYVLRATLPNGYQYTMAGEGWSLGTSCVGGIQGLVATSPALTIAGGQAAEAGVAAIPVGSFSGRAWNDQNNNGVMDEGEPGAPNITLTLKGAKTGNTYTLTTDDTGLYSFTGLRNDTYAFTAALPEGKLFARYSVSGGDARSVFTVEGITATREFAVVDAQDVTDKNVGVIDRAAITGIAFLDENYNGVYDEGEPPYAGVTLEVIKNSNDKSMGKAVTGEDGRYAFPTLRGSEYRLRAILPNDGSIFTLVPENAQGLMNLFAAREGRRENTIDPLRLTNGVTAETCVGVAMGGTVTGTVWMDAGYDGVRGGSDRKLSGVKVQLTDETGAAVATATTNANGKYLLEGIMPGSYRVRFLRREGYAFTRYRPQEESGNRVQTLASDGYGETAPFAVAMGQRVEGVDAGMLASSTLSGVFFDDLNDNGLQDEGEGGYTDGQVRLASLDGEIDLTQSVAADGAYFFDGVMPGEYTLTYLLPAHATLAKVAQGGNTLEGQGRETVLEGFTAKSGQAYTVPLVGAVTLGSLEGTAFHDSNGSGVQDAGEAALPGVSVALQATSGGDPAQTVTANDGRFALDGLRPGAYTLRLSMPDGYIIAADLAPSGIALPAQATATVSCPWAALVSRAENWLGAVQPATVRASVWLDENRDGNHAQEERLYAGLLFELYDEARGAVVQTERAADDGFVAFQNVRPSVYTLRFDLPSGAQPAGSGNFTASGQRMQKTGIAVAEGETVEGISGGLVCRTSIGGVVALDENGARTPLEGVTVNLYQGDGVQPVQTAQTDSTGAYRFDGLWPDSYTVGVQAQQGMIFVKPGDPNYPQGASAVTHSGNGEGLSDPITLLMAQHQTGLAVVLIKPARVGDQAWLDSNRNGLIDTDEPSINGVTVTLMENGEAAYTTVTNEWGYYEFSDVYPGTYTLAAQAYPELAITQSIPSLRIIGSCLTAGDGESATSDPFGVASGTTNFDMNLGYILPDGAAMPEGVRPGAVQNWTR